MIDLVSASDFVRLHRGKVFVVKVGGACLGRPPLLRALARQLAVIEACGAKVVVVHGGGPQTDALQQKLGEAPRKVDGRRVTSKTGLRALRLATCGELNADFAGALTAAGAPAVGFCAGTGGCVTAARRPPAVTTEGIVDFGEVGDVIHVDPGPLRALLDAGFTPVVCPPASDGRGGFLNVNADLMAAKIAVALGAQKLVLVTSEAGILTDPRDVHSLVSHLTLEEMAELKEAGKLEGGMHVKSAAIKTAIEGGVERVHVVSGIDTDALLGEIYTTHGTGTLITSEAETAPDEDGEGAPSAGGATGASGSAASGSATGAGGPTKASGETGATGSGGAGTAGGAGADGSGGASTAGGAGTADADVAGAATEELRTR